MKIITVNLRKGIYYSKRIIIVTSLLLLVALSINTVNRYSDAVYASAEIDLGNVIIIDAGHGGEDPGAIGEGNVYEKDLNLQISMLLGQMLNEKGYTVVYTRTEDKMLYSPEENVKGFRKLSDLKNRVKVSELYPDALMISIHMNSFGDSKYSGLQAYYEPNNADSRSLADKIQSSVKSELQKDNNRVIKEGKGLYLLENCKSTGVLIECGFLSNNEECKKLSEKEYQNQLCFAIVCGIIEYTEAKQ